MIEVTLRGRLLALEKRCNLSGRQLAERAGIRPSTYGNYKNRESNRLPFYIANKLADAVEPFGVPRQDVMALSGFPLDRPLTDIEMRFIELLNSVSDGTQVKMLRMMEILAIEEEAPKSAKQANK